MEFDEGAPLFAQLGEDARRASAVEGRTHVERIVAHVTGEVDRFLAARGG